jgi:MYXO-CTERM domain-containing protein
MDDVWARVGLVSVALGLAVLAAFWQRRRRRSPIREVPSGDLSPGVYFFSSETCSTCARARDQLDRVLGQAAYTEVRWEDRPGPFNEFGVDAVPAVLIVRTPGKGRLFPGQPDQALAEL